MDEEIVKQIKLSGPLTVGWDITNACNLRCKHCYASASTPLPDELPLDEVKRIVDDLDKSGTVLIALAGGEPLVRKDIIEIVRYIRSKGIEIFLNSNGVLLTKELAGKLKEAGLNHIEISVDGIGEAHDFLRGEGTFDQAVEGFRNAKEAGLSPGIMSTIIKSNMDQIEPLIDFFKKEGSVGIGFLRFKPVGRGNEHKDFELDQEERKDLIRRVYKKRVEIGEQFYLKVETPLSILIAMEFPELMKLHPHVTEQTRGCPGGITMCHITSSGKVTSCSQMPVIAGDLKKDSIINIWKNSELFKKLRTREFSGKCGNCKHMNYCGGCRTAAYLDSGDVLGGDPGCWLDGC